MTIHSEHPFLDPSPDQARRLRGRLGGQVTLLTTGAGAERAGLTVSSAMVATGEPAYVLVLVDPDAELGERLLHAPERACVLQLLQWRHRDVAERFAGQLPAPGGLFAHDAWEQTPSGPRLADATTWADLVVEEHREVGWSALVTLRIAGLVVGDPDEPLLHRRGRYHR